MSQTVIGTFSVPEQGVGYRLIERLGKDGKTYWQMQKVALGDRRTVVATYSLHKATCQKCGTETMVCDCNAFFWNRTCKHVDMRHRIIQKAVSDCDPAES